MKNMKKVIKLTENDLNRIVRRTIEEQSGQSTGQTPAQTPAQPTKQGTITIHVPQLPNINKQDLETYFKSPEFQKLLLNKFKERTNENDLSRMVRRALNEQLRPRTTSNPNTPSSTRTTSTPSGSLSPTTNFNGKTVNLYKDIANKTYGNQAKIIQMGLEGTTLSFKTNLGYLKYNCTQHPKLMLQWDPKYKREGQVLYSKNFTDILKLYFCNKSSGGSNVPNADFASNNQKPNSDFA